MMGQFMSSNLPALLKALGGLGLLLLGTGVLVWFFERRRNPDQFGGGAAKGIGSGFWWSAVTMTTVGYGDKAPLTLGGRIVGLVWMFAAIIMISSFTAAITSSLTLTGLGANVRGPADLMGVRTAVVANTTAEGYLRSNLIDATGFDSGEEALEAVAAGKFDALVYDAPILRYLVKEAFKERIQVLPNTFTRQDYGIALPPGSPLREPLNQALIAEIRDYRWQELLLFYLGQAH
jgi:ABC-type amino acid transport substrate-binding protein